MEKFTATVYTPKGTYQTPVFNSVQAVGEFIQKHYKDGVLDVILNPENEEAADHISFQDYGWCGAFYPYDM